MYSTEFDSFKATLTDLCIAVNRPYNDDLVRVFWDDLRWCQLPLIQEHATRLRREGKKQFTTADLRPPPRAAGTFEPARADLDKFDRFGNIQFWKFLRLYDTTREQLPELLRRKREVIDSAREDPDMHIPDGLDDEFRSTMERQHGELLHGILFTAWRQVIGATDLPRMHADGFVRVGAAS